MASTRSITTLSGRRRFWFRQWLLYLCSGLCRAGEFRLSYITFYALIAVAFVWVLWTKPASVRTFLPLAVTRKRRNIWCQRRPEPADDLRVVWRVHAFGGMLEAGRIGSATNNLGLCMNWMLSRRAWWAAYRSAACGDGDWRGDRGDYFYRHQLCLTYIGVNPYWQYIIKGAIISSPWRWIH